MTADEVTQLMEHRKNLIYNIGQHESVISILHSGVVLAPLEGYEVRLNYGPSRKAVATALTEVLNLLNDERDKIDARIEGWS
jgi:hypothetical protein